LSSEQVEKIQESIGFNEVEHEKAPAWYIQLLQAFVNPFIVVLIVIACISLVTDVILASREERDFKTVIVVSIMVFLSSFIRFWQEFRSNQAAEKLKGMVKTTASI